MPLYPPPLPTPVSVANGGTGAATAELARTALGAASAATLIRLSADQAITSSVTLTDATGFSWSLTAGTYFIKAHLVYNSASGTPGFKAGLAYSGTVANAEMIISTMNDHVSPFVVNEIFSSYSASSVRTGAKGMFTAPTVLISAKGAYDIESMFDVSDSGTLKLQWAQAVSNGTAMNLCAGSWMEVYQRP